MRLQVDLLMRLNNKASLCSLINWTWSSTQKIDICMLNKCLAMALGQLWVSCSIHRVTLVSCWVNLISVYWSTSSHRSPHVEVLRLTRSFRVWSQSSWEASHWVAIRLLVLRVSRLELNVLGVQCIVLVIVVRISLPARLCLCVSRCDPCIWLTYNGTIIDCDSMAHQGKLLSSLAVGWDACLLLHYLWGLLLLDCWLGSASFLRAHCVRYLLNNYLAALPIPDHLDSTRSVVIVDRVGLSNVSSSRVPLLNIDRPSCPWFLQIWLLFVMNFLNCDDVLAV